MDSELLQISSSYRKPLWMSVVIVSFLLLLTACSHSPVQPTATTTTVVPKGSRVLGIDANFPSSDYGFVAGYQAALGIGIRAGTVHTDWNANEGVGSGTTSGAFTDNSGQLAAADAYYASTTPPSQVSLTICPIDTPGLALPSDLTGQTMDQAVVITRFKEYIDWWAGLLPSASFTSIQIGNEVDVPAQAADAAYWTQYKAFLGQIVPYVKAKFPSVKVGFTVTLYGALATGAGGSVKQAGILDCLSVVDLLGVTYYPLTLTSGGVFVQSDPSVVNSDIAALMNTVANKPVYIQEAGYATSTACGGSPDRQAAYFSNLFAAWDTYADRIPFIAILRMNDLSNSLATSTAANYGLSGNSSFIAYLETLGLRNYTAPTAFKPAWTTVSAATKARGWW